MCYWPQITQVNEQMVIVRSSKIELALVPWITFKTPLGKPVSTTNSASIMQAPERKEGKFIKIEYITQNLLWGILSRYAEEEQLNNSTDNTSVDEILDPLPKCHTFFVWWSKMLSLI